MKLTFEPLLAFRYLRSKRKEVFISIITVISVLGVAVSVMVLDIVLSIMTGFEEELQTKLIDANAHIVVRRLGGDIDATPELLTKIREVQGVAAAFPFTYNQAMISTPFGSRGLLVRGLADDEASRKKLLKVLKNGANFDKLFSPAAVTVNRPDGREDSVNLPPLIIGRALRESLSIAAEAPVMLFAPDFTAAPQGLVPKLKRFAIVGFYSSGLIEYENGLAYASIKDAQNFFGLGGRVSGVEVVLSDSDLLRARDIAQNIVDNLSESGVGYYATDWTEQNKPLWDAIRLEKKVYFIVLLLLILVASFSIISTLIMIVMEKGKDIAILKSMGATDRSILRVFLIQGCLIGFTGVLLGTLFGYLGCIGLREYGFQLDERVFSLSQVPVHMLPQNFILVAISGLIITALAGIYPAKRAAGLRPAEALRYE